MKQENKKQLKKDLCKKAITGLVLVIVFLFVFSFGLTSVVMAGDDDNEVTEEDKDKAEDKEDEIKKLEKKIKKIEANKAVDVNTANVIKGSINNLVGDINVIEKKIDRTEDELDKLQTNIQDSEKDIVTRKEQMGVVVRKINRQNTNLKLIVLDKDKGLDEYIESADTMNILQKQILADLNNLKENRRNLAEKKKEEDEVKKTLATQKVTLEKERVKKNWLLGAKNKEINAQNAKIKSIESEMAALNSAISSLLGKNFNTNDIRKAAKYASKKTGVREAFILGMLTVETNLGKYTGGCNYKESRMSSYRKTLFKQLCKKIDRDYKKMKVSCPPANYRGTGGAMGVAQFMSDTWVGYEKRIAAATGHKNPDPWNLTDGVMAMALKLANDGATKKSGEWRAASRYLGTCSTPNTRFYCENVLNYAKRY